MKVIGIIGAMEEEVSMLKEKMTEVTVKEKAGMEFFHGMLKGHEAVVVRSGIGKVNAGICTQILADDFHVGRCDQYRDRRVSESRDQHRGTLSCPQILCSMIWMQESSAIRRDRSPGWIPWLFPQTRDCANLPARHAVR